MKKCRVCEIQKHVEDFYDAKHESTCKGCMSVMRKVSYERNKEKRRLQVSEYRKNNPEKIRDTKLRQAYGVGIAYFDAKLKEQGGTCGCCKQNRRNIWRGKEVNMALDHDHNTGKPRGVLCIKCNRALGLLEENQEYIISLLEYIRKYQN